MMEYQRDDVQLIKNGSDQDSMIASAQAVMDQVMHTFKVSPRFV
jgi:hypothetical protein